MRHPVLQPLVHLALCAAGLAGAAALGRIADPSGLDMLMMRLFALAIASGGLVYFILDLRRLRGRARLRAGDEVIARWRLGASEWEAFRALDAERSRRGRQYRNDAPPRPAPASGVEIVFGARGVLIGGDYRLLDPSRAPAPIAVDVLPGPPACLEFTIVAAPGQVTGGLVNRLRVPIAADAADAGQTVLDHYRALISGSRSRS